MEGGGARIRVAVGDAQPLFMDGVRAAIDAAPALELVCAASTPLELAQGISAAAPDVAVVGLLSGAAVDAWLTAVESPDRLTELLLLIDAIGEDQLFAALRTGARGVGSRSIAVPELVAAIAAVAAGTTYLSVRAQEVLLKHMRAVALSPASSLTAREQEVLAHLVDGKSTAAIAGTLFLGRNTVKTHLHRIYEKLGVSNRAGAVREAMRRGLLT